MDSGSLKESEGAILEVKPRKDAVKDKEEQGFKKLRIVYKRHLKIQGEWRRPVFSYKEVLETSSNNIPFEIHDQLKKGLDQTYV